MTGELIGGYAAASDREQMGRFLRYAFPLDLESFKGLPRGLEKDCAGASAAGRVAERRSAVH
jgi:hypothetical protein